MSTQSIRKLITVGAYHMMAEHGFIKEQERVELIQGEILQMAPTGSEHAGKVKRLNKRLGSLLDSTLIIGVQDPVYLNDLSEPEPDLSILKPRNDFYEKSHPRPEDILLIIEVADSSLEFDKKTKLPLYAAAGIAEYWIVNLPEKTIEAYHTPVGGTYKFLELVRPGEQITFRAFDQQLSADELLG